VFKEQFHLAIFSFQSIDRVLSGEKRTDIRLSQRAIPPYRAIQRGDRVLIKESGGGVYGEAKVSNALFYNNLNQKKVENLKERYNKRVKMDSSFWRKKSQAQFATIIFFQSVRRYITPINFKKRDSRAWVVLA
jgi:hypothetical protein